MTNTRKTRTCDVLRFHLLESGDAEIDVQVVWHPKVDHIWTSATSIHMNAYIKDLCNQFLKNCRQFAPSRCNSI